MTALAVLRMLAEQGASQVAVTALHVLVWPGIALAIALPALAWRRYHQRRTRITHMVFLPPAEPCPCCTTSPRESDDCTCREDCGAAWCQAADPPDHIEGCGPGRNLLAYPSLACPACDRTAAQTEAAPEPMFYEHGHVIGRDGRDAILRRARADDQAEADEFDKLIAELKRQQGDGRG